MSFEQRYGYSLNLYTFNLHVLILQRNVISAGVHFLKSLLSLSYKNIICVSFDLSTYSSFQYGKSHKLFNDINTLEQKQVLTLK